MANQSAVKFGTDGWRARIADEWETLEFDALQSALREIIDRIDVDGPNLRITLRA